MVDGPIPYEVEYLFWVGCAGAIDDRAKKVTKAVAELHAHRRRRVRRPRLGRDLLGRPGPPHGQRVRLPAAGHGERRDAQRRLRGPRAGHAQDRRDLPALLQLARPGVPAGRRRVRGHPPHAAAQPARRGGPAHPGHAGRPQGHLPRPVLPRPAQQGLHAAARDPRLRPGPLHPGDAPLQGPRLLLRRRRRAHVDGGEDRQADQRRAHRGGARARSRRHLHRLPVLHHDAQRRAEHEEAERRGQGPRRGPRRQPDPAALDGRRSARPGTDSGPEVGDVADDPAGTGSAGHRARHPATRRRVPPPSRAPPYAGTGLPVLLQLRVTVPPDRTDRVRELFENDPGTAHLAVLPGASVSPAGDLVLADVARESADGLVARAARPATSHRDGAHRDHRRRRGGLQRGAERPRSRRPATPRTPWSGSRSSGRRTPTPRCRSPTWPS